MHKEISFFKMFTRNGVFILLILVVKKEIKKIRNDK